MSASPSRKPSIDEGDAVSRQGSKRRDSKQSSPGRRASGSKEMMGIGDVAGVSGVARRMSRQGSKDSMGRRSSNASDGGMGRRASDASDNMGGRKSSMVRRKSTLADLEPDERVVVLGGIAGPTQHDSSEVYSHTQCEFSEGPRLALRRWGCASALLDGVRHIVVGGSDGCSDHDTTEIVTPLLDGQLTVAAGPRLGVARSGCAAVRLNETYVIVVGGYKQYTTELLDSPLPPPPDPDAEASRPPTGASRPPTGGSAPDPLETTVAEHEKILAFFYGPRLSKPRSCCAAIMIDEIKPPPEPTEEEEENAEEKPPVNTDCRLLVIGGYDNQGSTDSTEVANFGPVLQQDPEDINTGGYDLEKKVVFIAGPRMASRRAACVALRMSETQILVLGGFDGTKRLKSTEILDLKTMTFSPGPSMLRERAGCTVCPIGTDKKRYLVCGGQDTTPDGYLNTTEIFDRPEDEEGELGAWAFRGGPQLAERRAYATSLRYVFDPKAMKKSSKEGSSRATSPPGTAGTAS